MPRHTLWVETEVSHKAIKHIERKANLLFLSRRESLRNLYWFSTTIPKLILLYIISLLNCLIMFNSLTSLPMIQELICRSQILESREKEEKGRKLHYQTFAQESTFKWSEIKCGKLFYSQVKWKWCKEEWSGTKASSITDANFHSTIKTLKATPTSQASCPESRHWHHTE